MSKTITTPYDTADYLTTPAKRALYLEIMIEETDGDPVWIMRALNTIARSEGMTSVAKKSKLSRENLYRALSGNKKPEFGTILKVMSALGLQFHVVAKATKKPRTLTALVVKASRPAVRPALSKAPRNSDRLKVA